MLQLFPYSLGSLPLASPTSLVETWGFDTLNIIFVIRLSDGWQSDILCFISTIVVLSPLQFDLESLYLKPLVFQGSPAESTFPRVRNLLSKDSTDHALVL